ncbi:hypothetical protein FZEAL_5210 [Fusarium zealandicum]|uniref:Major facilitator superfamily (MFS) profile domain-containing protein n=1 Tax=Fusarium zealandicum TaxID=1053134 RepID=A0A8H4UK57_9HYPO|nr:hypothetical protein FZEAL_5210 [Fusarium zealandicum]
MTQLLPSRSPCFTKLTGARPEFEARQGLINVVFVAETSRGSPLGGLLADSVGWRWSFLGHVPLCFVAFIAAYFILELPPVGHDHWLTKMRQIDFLGAFTLVIAVVALLAGLDSGSNLGWSYIITVVSLSLTRVLFGLFLFVEIKVASNPFAPVHIIFDLYWPIPGITTTLVGLLAYAAVEDTAVAVACPYLSSGLSALASASALDQPSSNRCCAPSSPPVYTKELPPQLADQVRSSYQVATLGALALILICLIVAFLKTFFIK